MHQHANVLVLWPEVGSRCHFQCSCVPNVPCAVPGGQKSSKCVRLTTASGPGGYLLDSHGAILVGIAQLR